MTAATASSSTSIPSANGGCMACGAVRENGCMTFGSVILCTTCTSAFPGQYPELQSSTDESVCSTCQTKALSTQQWRSVHPPGSGSASISLCVQCAIAWDAATVTAGVWSGCFTGVLERGEATASLSQEGPSEYKLPMAVFLRVPIRSKGFSSLLTASSGFGNSLVEDLRV
jgi:hypothetical protein